MAWAIYLTLLALLVVMAPAQIWDPHGQVFVVILGALSIGTWRWSWGFVHFLRSLWYRRVTFRRWRRRLDTLAAFEAENPGTVPQVPQLFIVVTSYRIQGETTALAMTAAIEEAIAWDGEVRIVASIVEMAEQRLIKDLFRRLAPPPRVRLLLVRGRGTGKRDGLAWALRAVSRAKPRAGAVVLVQDGDAVLPPGCLAATLPFFALWPDLAALTTDEDCLVARGGRLMQSWHRLRFAQRHMLMGSMGLSRRLLTLTGRMSMLRVEIATDPSFVEAIQNDVLDHWRFGPLKLLTGEDKSAAWWILSRQRPMVYVPDVKVITIEHPPADSLPRAGTLLMLRWFGNMLRGSGRAIAAGPKQMGIFTWWCFVDQRISMWTPLVGPLAMICLSFVVGPVILYAYLLWVMVTRLLQALALATARSWVDGLWPVLIYVTQLWSALVKTWVLFHLDRQRWTRQNIALDLGLTPGAARIRGLSSAALYALAMLTLFTAVALATGLLVPAPGSVLAGIV